MKQNSPNLEEQLFKGKFKGETLKRVLMLTGRHWPLLVGFLLSIAFTAFMDSLNTYLSQFIIDRGVIPKDVPELIRYGSYYGGLFIINSLNFFVFFICAGRLGEKVQFDLRKKQFEHLQKLSFSFFDKTSSGWLLSRITSDSRRIAELTTWMFLDIVWGAVNIIIALIFISFIDLKMMLIVAITAPLLVGSAIFFRSKLLGEYRKVRSINSQITGAYSENIAGIKVVKALNRENKNLKGFSLLTHDMHKASFRAGWLSAIFLPMVQFITTIAVAVVLWTGGKEVAEALPGNLTAGELRAVIGYITFMMWPVLDLARVFSEMQRSIASAERVFSLLDTEAEIQDKPGAKEHANFKGRIKFKDVSFFYNEDAVVLEDFNLDIEPGEMIAIVGPTGGGKTTIVNLAARFYEPRKGKILFDGEDYRNYTQQALQRRMGVVLQDPHLFSGTIKENLLYGNPDATDKEIENAARLARAHEMIIKLPGGYNEEVGEAGNLLSTGQKQLISLARTILSKPDIIIMDEATSSIDSLTEHEIQAGMEELMSGRTSFVIAHRLSTIREADRILVIEEGRIKEMGNHKELLRQKGHYYGLYTSQMRNEKEIELGLA